MNKPEFVCITYIATTPERLWQALTEGNFTRRYWYDRRIESDWQIGSPVRFFDGASDDLTDSGVVLECDPPRRLVYTFKNEFDPQKSDQAPSRVAFTLEPYDGVVKLTLVHDRLHDLPAVEHFREGWAPILSSLKTFLETGDPLPQLRKFEEQGRVGRAGGAEVQPRR
ncbi:MAG TPA: SRPBCC family protein [Anaerolineaceae bacterium]|nr:SRPBCC family protein [Anaerolineaceae bacterium]